MACHYVIKYKSLNSTRTEKTKVFCASYADAEREAEQIAKKKDAKILLILSDPEVVGNQAKIDLE